MIPIYRAKKKDSDEYIIGNLMSARFYGMDEYCPAIQITKGRDNSAYDIDTSTLAIHFPDMIDSEGTKIFASLSEDGKGGDKIHNIIAPDNFNEMLVRLGRRKVAIVCDENGEPHYLSKNEWNNYKVTGIQE